MWGQRGVAGRDRRSAGSLRGGEPGDHRQPPADQRGQRAADYSPNLDTGRYYSAEKILAGRLHVRSSNPDLAARGP